MPTSDIKKGPLYVDSTNNRVGIGTASPSEELHVIGDIITSGYYRVASTQEGGIFDTSGNNGLTVTGSSGSPASTIRAYAGGSERMRIDSLGNVGIGTSSPTGFSGYTSVDINNATSGAIIDLSQGDSMKGRLIATASTMAIETASSVPIIFQPTGTEAMRIDSLGNVGIGTVSPHSGSKLHILAAGTTQLRLDSSGTATGDGSFIRFMKGGTDIAYIGVAGTIMGSTSNDTMFYAEGANNMRFSTNGVERLRITSAGNLFVGTTTLVSPNPGHSFSVGNGSQHAIGHNNTSSGTYYSYYSYNGSVIGSITQSGTTSVAYNTSSDYRLKENVVADWDATARLKQLNPVRFNFIADADTTVDGFLAHEVQDIVPEAITGTKDAMRDEEYTVSAATGDIYTPAIEAVLDEDGVEVTPAVAEVIHSTDVERPEELAEGQQWRETTAAVMGTRSVPDYQGIDQSKLVPLLVKTIQELEARIVALEAK